MGMRVLRATGLLLLAALNGILAALGISGILWAVMAYDDYTHGKGTLTWVLVYALGSLTCWAGVAVLGTHIWPRYEKPRYRLNGDELPR